MWVQLCIGHSGVHRGQYRQVKGRLFACCKSFLVLLKNVIAETYVTTVSVVGQALVGCRHHMGDVTAVREV